MPKVETFSREDALKQAIEVFHDKGYNATSMQDLVDATGLNRSSIYNSFESKSNLYLECLKAYEDKYNRQTTKRLLQSKNGFQAIRLIFELYLDEISRSREERGCLIVNCKSEMANHEDNITKFLNVNQNKTLILLEDLVSQGQSDKSVNTGKSAQEYALYLYASLQGFRMTGILIQERKQLQSIMNTVLQTLN